MSQHNCVSGFAKGKWFRVDFWRPGTRFSIVISPDCSMQTEVLQVRPESHGLGLCDLDLHPQQGWVLSGGCDGRLLLSSAASGAVIKGLEEDYEIYAVAVAPDASSVAVGCADHYVRVFSLPDLADPVTVTRFAARVRGLAYSPDSSLL